MTFWQWLGVVSIVWGVGMFFVLCLCKAAAIADSHPASWFKGEKQ